MRVASPLGPQMLATPLSPPRALASMRCDLSLNDRRSACASLLAAMALAAASPRAAFAKVDSVNPANNYYFPMARYRYTPRIFRAWIAADELAPGTLKDGDWEGMDIIWFRMDDATTVRPETPLTPATSAPFQR